MHQSDRISLERHEFDAGPACGGGALGANKRRGFGEQQFARDRLDEGEPTQDQTLTRAPKRRERGDGVRAADSVASAIKHGAEAGPEGGDR